jgi:hypothetical protein
MCLHRVSAQEKSLVVMVIVEVIAVIINILINVN